MNHRRGTKASLRVRLTVVGAVGAVLLLIGAAAASAVVLDGTSAPTISSDKLDYPPGGTVLLTGTGWSGDSTVHIFVNDTIKQSWNRDVHVNVDADGNISDSFQLPSSFISDYDVTATGDTTGRMVTTTFTDSAANLDQCTNGKPATPEPCRNDASFSNWVNGAAVASKAHWAEDEFIPYRAKIDGVTAGGHTISIVYDTVHSGGHAIDYLGSFDATETTSATANTVTGHANNNNPCLDVLTGALAPQCTPGTPTNQVHIPDGQVLQNCATSTGTPPTRINGLSSDRFMSIWGPTGTTITGMTYYAQNVVSGTGQCSTTLTISFNIGGSAPSNTVVLAWGGHIARGAGFNGWGAGTGASGVEGSPYHMAFSTDNDNPNKGLDGASQGAQDRALQAAAVTPESTITIIKNTVGGDDKFGYTTTGGGGLPPLRHHDRVRYRAVGELWRKPRCIHGQRIDDSLGLELHQSLLHFERGSHDLDERHYGQYHHSSRGWRFGHVYLHEHPQVDSDRWHRDSQRRRSHCCDVGAPGVDSA